MGKLLDFFILSYSLSILIVQYSVFSPQHILFKYSGRVHVSLSNGYTGAGTSNTKSLQ